MKTYLECLSEAAERNKKPHISAAIKLELSDDELSLLQEAADLYTELSKSHIPVVVREGAIEAQSVHRGKDVIKFPINTTGANTPTEPLPAEGVAQNGCVENLLGLGYSNEQREKMK